MNPQWTCGCPEGRKVQTFTLLCSMLHIGSGKEHLYEQPNTSLWDCSERWHEFIHSIKLPLDPSDPYSFQNRWRRITKPTALKIQLGEIEQRMGKWRMGIDTTQSNTPTPLAIDLYPVLFIWCVGLFFYRQKKWEFWAPDLTVQFWWLLKFWGFLFLSLNSIYWYLFQWDAGQAK